MGKIIRNTDNSQAPCHLHACTWPQNPGYLQVPPLTFPAPDLSSQFILKAKIIFSLWSSYYDLFVKNISLNQFLEAKIQGWRKYTCIYHNNIALEKAILL